MKLFNTEQIREWDAYTIQHEPISSAALMERAAMACVEWMVQRNCLSRSIKIFCGKGNNGGDGLATARILMDRGLQPKIFILEFGSMGTADFQVTLQLLQQSSADIHFIQDASFFPDIDTEDLVIDTLFGTGINRPLTGISAGLVNHLNQSGAQVISVDLPSGMALEQSSLGTAVVRASHTLSFQRLKRCLLMAENADCFGDISILDIGLHPGYPETTETVFETIAPGFIKEIFKPRDTFSHKGNFGHALLFAGNQGKMGAAVLTAKACMRSGPGLLTMNVPSTYASIIHSSIPEAMVMYRDETVHLPKSYTCIGIGPGFGTGVEELAILTDLLKQYSHPMVIDADAITLLSQLNSGIASLPGASILTPHPKEFDRLFGVSVNDFDRADKAISLSLKYPLVIVLKGHHTLVAFGGKGWYNLTGNAGMAKGGSGDVLTGILTALLAQQYSPLHAALLGVYLHGLTADLSLNHQTMETMLATDIIEHLGQAFLTIQQ